MLSLFCGNLDELKQIDALNVKQLQALKINVSYYDVMTI